VAKTPRPLPSRRELMKLSPLLLGSAFFVPRWREALLSNGVAFSDWFSARLFRSTHVAPTYDPSQVVPLERFPYNGYDVLEPDIDLETWRLVVSGIVAKPGEYTLEEIRGLPKVVQNTRHVCVEGWDAIGRFGGARLADLLALVGADSDARYIVVTCADDYYESLDIATARHPQTLLCYEMYDRPLNRGHGAPLRLQIPTKLGYKQAKYLRTLAVTRVLPVRNSYWGDQGYSWHGGL
jgi:DMSO/TMAO reductase YedYZ molybdopterin-dependent catalytic subunit